MPSYGDQLRAEIALRLHAEGLGQADAMRAELERAKAAMETLSAAFVEGSKTAEEMRSQFPRLQSAAGFWEKLLAAAVAAEKALDDAAQEEIAGIDRVALAREKANARFEAEMEKLHRAHMAFLAQEEAAEVAAAARRQAIIDATRKVDHVEGHTFRNREQEQLNALLEEGARVEHEAAAAHLGNARAAAVEALEIERLGGATVIDVTAANTDTDATRKLEAAKKALAATVISTNAGISGVGRSAVMTAQQLDQSRSATERASYGFLHIAHAVQDAQYGFGAVLNNIPLVVQAIGGGPGLAGTVMIAGVAFEVLKGHLGDVSVALGMAINPMQGFARNTEDLKKKLEALEAKRWKVDVDYEDIRRARDQLEKLREAEAAYEAAKRTKDKATLADKAREVSEGAGGPDALAAAVLARSTGAGMQFGKQSDIDQARHLEKTIIPLWERRLKEATWFQKPAVEATVAKYKADLFALEDTLRTANIQHAKDEVGQFLAGDVGAIGRMKALVDENARILPFGVAQAIRKMPGTPEEALAKEMEKKVREAEGRADAAERQDAKAREDQARGVREAAIAPHVAAFGAKKSLGGDIEERTKELVAGGEKDDIKIRAAVLDATIASIKEAGIVPEGLVAEVAARVIVPHVAKALGELAVDTGPGKDIVAAAREGIAAARAKDAGKRGKADAGVQHAADRASIAAKLMERTEDNITPEQATVGADEFLRLVKGGTNPALAQAKVMAHMDQFVIQQIRTAEQIVGMNEQMAMTLQRATLHMSILQAQIGMAEGRMRVQRVQKPMPWNTVPGG